MTAVNYWDRATKAILGDITLPHTIRYTPGSNKLATSRRAKDGTLIVQGINNNGKIANKKTVVIRGVDEGLYYDILAEFEKADTLEYRKRLEKMINRAMKGRGLKMGLGKIIYHKKLPHKKK